MIIDDILDEIDTMENVTREYLSYLIEDQTEEDMYEAVEECVCYSFITDADDIVSFIHSCISQEWKHDDVIDGIFDFNGMMGYFDDEEIEENIYNEALDYFTQTKNRVLDEFAKFI
jgi:hypothetical protein